jgi:integrase
LAILAECPFCHRKQSVKNRICKGCGQDLVSQKKARKVHYWIDYAVPNGKPVREPVGFSIEEARAADGKRKAQRVENPKILQRLPENKMTFQQLSDWYEKQDAVKNKSYYKTLQINIASFNKVFGGRIITTISTMDMKNYQSIRKKAGYSDSYIDQEIGAAKTIINAAYEEGNKVSADTVQTFKKVPKLLRKGSNKRNKVLTVDEFDRLIKHVPKHTLAILSTAFYTGMRKGEIVSLKWKQISFSDRFIYLKADQTKDKEDRQIFICNDLLQIFQALPRGGNDDFVFTYRGKPVNDLRTGLADGCKQAGIAYGRFTEGGFVMHDLRHTFVTMMRKAKVAASVRMEITGHSTIEMDNRYDAVDNDDMLEAFAAHEQFVQECRSKNGTENGVRPS